jgi:hypothetical protein
MRAKHITVFALLVGTWSSAAVAVDKVVVATARELSEQGLAAYDAGRYEEAATKLLQAYGAIKLPTFARNAADALEKQGRLVAAAELYLEATRLEPNELWRDDTQQQAQRDAAKKREALLPRIARVNIMVEGAPTQDAVVTMDVLTVPRALLGTEMLADPGTRHVVAKWGPKTVEQTVNLADGARMHVTLRFEDAPAKVPGGTLESQDRETQQPRHGGHAWRNVGWVGVGVGTAGVVTGAITGLMAMNKRSQLKDAGCSSTTCSDSKLQGKLDTYNSLRDVSAVSFIAGGVVAVAGVAILVWSSPSDTKASVGIQVGPRNLLLEGAF